jgi:hypothetical protein
LCDGVGAGPSKHCGIRGEGERLGLPDGQFWQPSAFTRRPQAQALGRWAGVAPGMPMTPSR